MTFMEIGRGNSPLILGFPHTSTELPEECAARLNKNGRALADTDWHVHSLYDGLVEDITTVRTPIHRYVIDVNRNPTGESLYPGQNTTGLCPLSDFDGNPIYLQGAEPKREEIQRRQDIYHTPYHLALEAEMVRVSRQHGFAVLLDCHSIRSKIPFLFEGTLPDFNVGTNGGTTCAPAIEAETFRICEAAHDFTSVLNGRFKGGWTTRHYGRPEQGWHAIQMELAQSTYLKTETAPWEYDHMKAGSLREHLRAILESLKEWRPA